jgi:hypothetical protein
MRERTAACRLNEEGGGPRHTLSPCRLERCWHIDLVCVERGAQLERYPCRASLHKAPHFAVAHDATGCARQDTRQDAQTIMIAQQKRSGSHLTSVPCDTLRLAVVLTSIVLMSSVIRWCTQR